MKRRHVACFALALGAAYALLDEWHQVFVAGRTAQLGDILIDSAGVLCGIAAAGLIRYLFRTRKNGVS
jgi:VanZ family protein